MELNKTEKEIIALIRENSKITIIELAEKTNKTPRTIKRNIKSLKDKNAAERIGSDKAGSWQIK